MYEQMNADFYFPFFPHCFFLPCATLFHTPPPTAHLVFVNSAGNREMYITVDELRKEDGFMFSCCSTYYKLLCVECGWLPRGCRVWKVFSKPKRWPLLMAAGTCRGRKLSPTTRAPRCARALKREHGSPPSSKGETCLTSPYPSVSGFRLHFPVLGRSGTFHLSVVISCQGNPSYIFPTTSLLLW